MRLRVAVPVRRVLSLVLAALLAIGVAAAIVASVRDRVAADDPPLLTTVRGVIGSEKQPFFRDPAVAAVFARHGLQVQVDTAGSRELATRVDLDRYDFAFPAGIPAAERIRRERKVTAFYQPFYTPMAVGTFKPIAKLLARAGVASPWPTATGASTCAATWTSSPGRPAGTSCRATPFTRPVSRC
jgi:hypothetical protein